MAERVVKLWGDVMVRDTVLRGAKKASEEKARGSRAGRESSRGDSWEEKGAEAAQRGGRAGQWWRAGRRTGAAYEEMAAACLSLEGWELGVRSAADLGSGGWTRGWFQ